MLTLYNAPATAGDGRALAAHRARAAAPAEDVGFDRREQKSPAYLKLNPAGVVPTLVDGTARCSGRPPPSPSTSAIDLPERLHAPQAGTPARAQYYQWMFFLANTLQPAYRAWFYPTEPAGEANVEASKVAARARIEAAWGEVAAHLEARGGPYLLGEQLAVVDFMATMLMRWSRNMPKPSDRWPALQAYAQRMKARPSWNELYRREGLTEWS